MQSDRRVWRTLQLALLIRAAYVPAGVVVEYKLREGGRAARRRRHDAEAGQGQSTILDIRIVCSVNSELRLVGPLLDSGESNLTLQFDARAAAHRNATASCEGQRAVD